MNLDYLLNEPYLNFSDFSAECDKLKDQWEKQKKTRTGEKIIFEFFSGPLMRPANKFLAMKNFRETTPSYTIYSTLLTLVYNHGIRKDRVVRKFNVEKEYDQICDNLLMIETTLCCWIVRFKEEGINLRLRTPESIERFASLPKQEIIERAKGRIPENYFSNRNIQVLLEINRELEKEHHRKMQERKDRKINEQK